MGAIFFPKNLSKHSQNENISQTAAKKGQIE